MTSNGRPGLADDTDPVSILELFTIGIGPSSSHTVGPMRAANRFAMLGVADEREVVRLRCTLHGSLALTGRGHATDTAVLLGLNGWEPETVDPDAVPHILAGIRANQRIALGGGRDLPFDEGRDLAFDPSFLPEHPNGMLFEAVFADGSRMEQRYFSIGGGAIVEAGGAGARRNVRLPHPFGSGADLLQIGCDTGLSIGEIVRANESAFRDPAETDAKLDAVRAAMFACIDRGLANEGELPGGLGVRRRARSIREALSGTGRAIAPSDVFEWVSLWALAVNEENAAGGRVVTAPTNGAAGVIPAVMRYYETFVPGATPAGSRQILYTAAAIGLLYKKRASISAAEMGCQGEVGVACSMAAAGLAAALGGSNAQIENAAEIGMEHNLGLTCDPVGGLVQIPCIERNTMGAIKAINAAYLALRGDGGHVVSLDAVIETMRQTGEDMRSQYKETSLGGLAVNVVEC
ncbi:L-serine ammonia-lyase [Sphingobium nicotianae]|uniref:L-serine dehydratase n=1 Tax=Sphingobium nicotianae TaxID=2782607 RepID=A0A9X1DDL2_9SPHN|nr:L-serine ammonia-lyase [Sphingobium nicotianae]MBT2188096.1 L-serine ammonia-lyase [Sphingobium nicotianae]